MQEWLRKSLRDDMKKAGDIEGALKDCEDHLTEVMEQVQLAVNTLDGTAATSVKEPVELADEAYCILLKLID